MKIMGFAATYSPDSSKANKHNYFMNGILKYIVAEDCCTDISTVSKMRSLYAVADGSKSVGDGGTAAFLCMDMMNDVFGADFQLAHKNYFESANRIVQSRSFSDNGAEMSVDIAALYVYRNTARVYSFGNISVFHKTDDGITKISGQPPKAIEIDEIIDKDGNLSVKKRQRKNTPHIGHISGECQVVPYISERIVLRKNDSVVMVTESVLSVLDKSDILDVLNDDNIPQAEKASAVISMAVAKNPDGNYTAQIVEGKRKKPVSNVKKAVIAAAVTGVIAFVGIFGVPVINTLADTISKFISTIMYGDLSDANLDEYWVPVVMDDEENSEQEQATKENSEPQPKSEQEQQNEANPEIKPDEDSTQAGANVENGTGVQSTNELVVNHNLQSEQTRATEQDKPIETTVTESVENSDAAVSKPEKPENKENTENTETVGSVPETESVKSEKQDDAEEEIEVKVDTSLNSIMSTW